jgi:hypothetical protein
VDGSWELGVRKKKLSSSEDRRGFLPSQHACGKRSCVVLTPDGWSPDGAV